MSLQFVFGNSGSGKSHYLYQYIVEESVRRPEKNYLVIVPEQFTMQTQKDLCCMHPRGGIMNIDVLSFGRLAHRVFEELGRDRIPVLDDEGKNLILRKIAGDYEDELTVLKGNLKKQGYISEVKSVISEFTQYGVNSEILDRFMDGLNQDSYLYYKLKDIRKIYDGFEEYLKEKYVTKEELLDVLSDSASESDLLRGCVVALDGFTGFTPVQDRLLGELLKICEKVMLTVEISPGEDPFVYEHPYQLFGLSKKTVTSLVQIAGESGTELEEPVYLWKKDGKGIPRRFWENPEMAFLEAHLFRYPRSSYRNKKDGKGFQAVSLHEVKKPADEAQYVAESIRRLVRTKGYRYRDFAVIASDMDLYADYLEKSCKALEIPVFMDYKKNILFNAFVEYLRSLLAMAEQNFTYESVFRHLRTGLCGFDQDETDRMENYCRALGLKGYKKWQQAWVRRTAQTGAEELEELNLLRRRLTEKTEKLMDVLKRRRKTVRDVTKAVYEYIAEEKIQEKLAEMEVKFQQSGELALAKEYSQIYRIVMELFDKFADLLGDENVSLREYCDLLDAGLEEAKVGVIPPSLDQVVIGDVERTRIRNIKVLFFVGANDTLLPGNTRSGGLLSDRDREQFFQEKISLSPGPKEKIYIQKFYLYMNLTKPSDFLSLSWSALSSEGKTLRPAYLIQDVRRIFPELEVRAEDQRPAATREFTRRTGIKKIAEGIRDRHMGLDDEWKEMYTWFWSDREGREEVRKVLEAGFLKKTCSGLREGQAAQLYTDLSRVSVTRLEQFASCSYAHFLSYGLRLTDREEYTFNALDLGNIAHQSLERFSRKADREKTDWTELSEQKREELIDESVEESVIEYGNTVLFSSARNEQMIKRIRRLIHRSVWALTKQLEKSDFRPSGYEMKFGSGKIDRIDTCEDEEGVYVKVTDYKTGMKSFDVTAFYHGLQMQLPVYLNAAVLKEKERHPGKEIIPAGIFYYRIQDPVVPEEESDEAVEKSILKELKLDGLVNSDEKVIMHLEKNLSGNSLFFPIGRNKDGSLSKSSKALPLEVFEVMLRYTKEKERNMKERMYSGEVQAAPYELQGATGCDFCPYRDICGFDVRIDGCSFRTLEKYSVEEAVQKMKEYLEKSREFKGTKKES